MAYIPSGEVDARVNDDPVIRFRNWLIADGHATDQELGVFDHQARGEVEEAWNSPRAAPTRMPMSSTPTCSGPARRFDAAGTGASFAGGVLACRRGVLPGDLQPGRLT